MQIKEIYEYVDRIGCLAFSTWTGIEVESRIAHFFAFDDEGIYFRTMNVKPFYKQLTKFEKLSVCGMYPQTYVAHDDNNLPYFAPGYAIRLSGDVRELTISDIEKKSKNDHNFIVALHDIKKYPTTKIFVLYKAKGEIFDFDFEMENRDHKLLRTAFSYGGAKVTTVGLHINEKCINCGACEEVCTFKAITAGDHYHICGERCDECGNCYEICPANAIELRKDL